MKGIVLCPTPNARLITPGMRSVPDAPSSVWFCNFLPVPATTGTDRVFTPSTCPAMITTMGSLLFTVLIIGVIAYAITAVPMAHPFRVIAHCILAIILITVIAGFLGYPIRIP